MNKTIFNLIKIGFSLLMSIVITLVLGMDIFVAVANKISDGAYQTHNSPNSEIIIIGMDEASIEKYGTMPWPRDIMAMAIEQLNSNSEKIPAVIGVDTLYTVEGDKEKDSKLINAAKKEGNVVFAANVTVGNKLVTLEDGTFYMDDYSVLLVENPFEELHEASEAGHINAMLDIDGILRHSIWEIDLENNEVYPSFNQVIYKKYMEFIGKEPTSIPKTDSKHRWYVPFTSKPGSYYDGFSIVDLIEGRLDEDFFAGKIVLIGPYALGMNDEYLTSIDHTQKMFGVEYQANAIAALINGELKYEVSELTQEIILFVITFITLFWLIDRKIFHSTIGWIALSGGWILFCLLMWNKGYVFEIYYIPIGATICYILSIIINYVKSTIEKIRITKTFKRYVAPEVVAKLLENQNVEPKLGGELTEIAVFFVDIRGFTHLSEALETHEVANTLNSYLTMMSDCILKNGGTLDKFIGDCAMAFWGAPLYQEDIAFKAVKTAVDMIERAEVLNKEFFEKYNHEIGIGIGINYGFAVVGNFGSPNRMDYTAIGDTVNVAARLESSAKSGTILVAPKVVKLLEGRVEFQSLGSEIKLKGKSNQIEIYEVKKIK